jgi:hypothetical protein
LTDQLCLAVVAILLCSRISAVKFLFCVHLGELYANPELYGRRSCLQHEADTSRRVCGHPRSSLPPPQTVYAASMGTRCTPRPQPLSLDCISPRSKP